MLRGEHIADRDLMARWAELLRWRLAVLRTEVVLGSVELARLGLIALALALQTIVLDSPGHFRPAPNAFFAVLTAGGTLLSLALCLAATLPLRRILDRRQRRILGVIALATLGLLSIFGIQRAIGGVGQVVTRQPYNNDGAVMDLYAGTQVLRGHNPYLKTNIVAALATIDAPAFTTTPLMDGQFRGTQAYPSEQAIQSVFLNVLVHRPRTVPPEFESKYNYPSGSFLFILPFIWLGLHDMRFLYALAVAAMGCYLAWRLPRSLRPLAPLLILANVPLIALTAGGQPDPLYGLALLVGYAEWNRSRLSPLCMGVAMAIKQLAWFFLPFYLLLIIRHFGWREALRRGGIICAVFLLFNLPFIIQSPGSYLTSISGPMTDPMFPLGSGLIALFVAGTIPLLPKIAFSLAELLAWAGGLFASHRWPTLPPATAAVLGALPLFFAWRSLVNYFYLVPLLVMAIMLADAGRQVRQER